MPLKIGVIVCLLLMGCQPKQAPEKTDEKKPPNIIWFVAEDMSPRVSFYGDSTARTPTLDALAKKGIVFENVFTVSGVCAPSRSSMITGCYPSSIGTQHMRQSSGVIDLPGIPKYNAVPPPAIKAFPELLRKAGYWTASYRKLDYQFGTPFTIWDSISERPHWRQRNKADNERPFFIYNTFEITHEINIWPDSTKHRFFQEYKIDTALLAQDVVQRPPLDSLDHYISKQDVVVPPYLPDTDLTRSHFIRHYYNIMRMDQQIGRIMSDLKEDGLEEDTILFFMSDHGDCLPRGKRWLYDSGTKVPLVVYIPKKYLPSGWKQSGRDDGLYSYLDVPPTVLEMAGITIPDWMQGKSILSTLQQHPRKFVYGARDRIDNRYDIRRSIRNDRFRYLQNFSPEKPYQQQQNFLEQMPLMHDILNKHREGSLTETQAAWLAESKPIHELYDLLKDPYEIKNVAEDPAYADTLQMLEKELLAWMKTSGDLYRINEMDQAEKAWPRGKQPKTAPVLFQKKDGMLYLKSSTKGASIAYRTPDATRWELYGGPIAVSGDSIIAKAVRYGYAESKKTYFAFH